MRRERSPRPASRLRLGSRPEEIEAAIQDRLAALADIDMRFEVGCRGLRRSVLPRSMKAFFLRQIRLRRSRMKPPWRSFVTGSFDSPQRSIPCTDADLVN